ncbi:MAG: histidine phosphatase family protein [Candidatus Marinimicrobia bacterium]|nr:histidine phosphatase family protein [Candidatus Neomarinimicrobiota bacterium]
MLLYIIRHGETEQNADGLLQGKTGGNLNTKGIEQARLTGLELRNKGITAIHSSNLDRALDTALIISDLIGAVLILENQLRERNLGNLEEKKWDDYVQAQQASGQSHEEFKPEGGESLLEMPIRLKPFLEEISGPYQRTNLLIVGHNALNSVLLDMLTDLTLAEIFEKGQNNCCINILDITAPMKAEVVQINDVSHLQELEEAIEDSSEK